MQYTDIWANDTYLQFMYERLLLIKELLSGDSVAVVHLDETRAHYLKVLLDEVFGAESFVNEIVWKRQTAHSDVGQGARHLGRLHDSLLVYGHGRFAWNELFTPYTDEYTGAFYKYIESESGRRYRLSDATAPGWSGKGNPHYEFLGVTRPRVQDWRSMVDSVAIDTAYDGVVFDVDLIDIPERRSDVVGETYDLEAPSGDRPAAVRITDMLGEEILVGELR
jgi:hypothetical protein